ncbi:MAG: diguanylate cyclase [Pseudomonadota bacterium]
MIRLANVLIVDADHSRADGLEKRLAHIGYHGAIAETVGDGRHAAGIEHPDLILIGTPRGGEAIELARALKAADETSDIPVLMVADAVTPDLCAAAFTAGLDDVLAVDCGDAELAARLRPLGRLSTMHAELHQRAVVARRLGIDARDRTEPPQDSRPSILVVGDDAAPIEAVLSGDGEITTTVNLYEAEDLLSRTNFDACVVSFSDEQDGALLAFCSQVRNNPRLFNLPILLLSHGIDPTAAYRSGATRVLPGAVDPVLLRTSLLTLVRRQQLRWSIRSALNDSLRGACRDEATGAYSRAFFDSYIEDRLAVAVGRNRHLAVAFFSAPSVAAVGRQFGDDARQHLILQLCQWITGLVRAEDLTAAFGEHEFCVVLPDTPLAEAEVVMHRIAGVLAYTDFAVREVYQPVKVWVQVGATDAQHGDDVPALLARARRNLG